MRLLRTNDVTRFTGLSRTTIWRLERKGEFPRRRQLTANAVGWREDEVRQWMEDLPAAVESSRGETAQPKSDSGCWHPAEASEE